ncbi:MAG: transposase [Pirellulales bacterium]|nr:transposase [Pirellulales bacterium]
MSEKRHNKVAKFQILKPAAGTTWPELANLLFAVRYRVFRLANLCISEHYLHYHLWRMGKTEEIPKLKISELNKKLREMIIEENDKKEKQNKINQDAINKKGALTSYVVDTLSQNKLGAVTSKSKWKEVILGKASLPTFRLNMAIPVRCDKPEQCRLKINANGDVELELMICERPRPRIILKTGGLSGSMKSVLDRLLENSAQSMEGYRQRNYEIIQDRNDGKKWYLHVSYDFPATERKPNSEIIVGVDVGFALPLYAALGNGHARLGWKQFHSLAKRIRSLQNQVVSRRRKMLRGGKDSLTQDTARSGHGRNRLLQPIEKLAGRIEKAYTTLNHQLSRSVVDFAKNHGAGIIQMEDLEGMKDAINGTFLGERWRYFELRQFIEYKAKEAGIEVRLANPKYTSRRCSACGYINMAFTREYRDSHRKNGKSAEFFCPECDKLPADDEQPQKPYPTDADYNAAKNLAALDIEKIIRRQCEKQGISYDKSPENNDL